MQAWLIVVIVSFFTSIKDLLLEFAKGFLKSLPKAFLIITVVNVVVNQIIDYVNFFMTPVVVFAGVWWAALGADTIVYIVITTLKIKLAMKLFMAFK